MKKSTKMILANSQLLGYVAMATYIELFEKLTSENGPSVVLPHRISKDVAVEMIINAEQRFDFRYSAARLMIIKTK